MNVSRRTRAVGIAAGIAVFVAAALFVTISANKTTSESAGTPVALTGSVVAPAEQLGKAFAAVAAQVKPAVVSVYSEKMLQMQAPEFPAPFSDDFFDQFFGRSTPKMPDDPIHRRQYRVPQRGMGSGMILDHQGNILTSYHVVSDVDEIKIQLADERTYPAKIVAVDQKTDVAIIRISGEVPSNLPSVRLGDSDALEDGYLVLAIGAPFGLTQTVTSGIISAKGRSDVGLAAFEDFLQTDAPINPGNSGGPLVNMRGEVIGMNSAIASGGMGLGGEAQSAGVGFAIPSNMIKTMLPILIKGGQITRGAMGVLIQDMSPDMADSFKLADNKGALVSEVNKDSPADKAGIRAGDVIVRFDGKQVDDTRQLRNLVAATAPDTKVKVDAIRDGKEKSFTVVIGKMPIEATTTAQPSGKAVDDRLAELGLSVQTLTPELARESGMPEQTGVLVSGVEPGSLASMANVQEGDLIVEVNRRKVATVSEMLDALGTSPGQVLLLLKRSGGSLYVLLNTDSK